MENLPVSVQFDQNQGKSGILILIRKLSASLIVSQICIDSISLSIVFFELGLWIPKYLKGKCLSLNSEVKCFIVIFNRSTLEVSIRSFLMEGRCLNT